VESVSDETEGGAERGGQAWRSGSQSLQIFLDRILHACMTRVYVCTVSHFASLRYSIIIYIIVVQVRYCGKVPTCTPTEGTEGLQYQQEDDTV